MFKFEENLAGYCKKRGFDGVICGHIHHAEIKEINGVMYMNDGDWVESCTALVEHHNGQWEIITWTKEKDDVDTNIDSSSREQPTRHSRKNRTNVQRSTQLRSSSNVNEMAVKV
jgi:predicted phosphodiesterase